MTTEVGVLAPRDDGLIARARKGDHEAFASLIVPRADRLLRTANAILGDESLARDAVQNALVSAWIHLPRLRDPDKFDAWINRVLRNECNQALRTRRRRVREIDMTAADGSGSGAAVTPDPSSSSLETAAVKAAFRRLSVDERTILLMHHLHGMPLGEVARVLGVPIGTAKSRLWTARRALERALEAER